MPASLRSLTSELVPLAIKIGDDSSAIVIQYRPHALTGDIEKKAAAFQKQGLELSALIEMTLPVVAEWDLLEYEGGPPVELTREALAKLVPGDILMEIMTQIGDDRKPDPKETD